MVDARWSVPGSKDMAISMKCWPPFCFWPPFSFWLLSLSAIGLGRKHLADHFDTKIIEIGPAVQKIHGDI